MLYKSRPVEIEAMRWHSDAPVMNAYGRERHKTAEEIVAWVSANGGEARYVQDTPGYVGDEPVTRPARLEVRTINGWAYAAPGHYVIKGSSWFWIEGPDSDPNVTRHEVLDFYPCDPGTFQKRWVLA